MNRRKMKQVLIVGSGDVARRIIPWLARRFRVCAVVRRPEERAALRALGARALVADLDQPSSLGRLAGIADYGLSSNLPRFHFANLENGTVRSFLVAHGKGSDPEHTGYLEYFSNVVGSNATSRGAYVTWEWYKGKYGTSIRLGGLEPDNSNALPRAIVMHPAGYASLEHIEKWGKLGRSDGCFAMSPADFNEALWHLSGGRLLYADKLGLV